MNEPKSYSGSCHCGKVRFEAALDLSKPVVTCNCSICRKTGTMLAFTGMDQFTLRSGAEALADYQFGKKQLHHLFCTTCGIRSFARGKGPDGREVAAVNVRCLEGVELESLKTHHYDGASL